MKNIFLVINKEKVYAYIVSIMTIVVVFFMSSLINSDLENAETASSSSIENVQNVTTETNGEIGEAISTSTPSNEANNNVENN